MAADIVGLEKLKTNLSGYSNMTSVYIYAGSRKLSIPAAICSHNNGNVLDQVESYLTEHATGENATKYYYVVVKTQGSKKENEVVGFTFAMETKNNLVAVNGPAPYQQQNQTDPKVYELYSELGYLRAENKRLAAENARLSAELLEADNELNEMAEIGAVEDPVEKYMPYLAPILGKMFGIETTPVNGVNEDIELSSILTELQKLDPEFKNNMFKLLKLAKNKPFLYKQAVKMLNDL